jgi:LPXTG-motif cell wall-anchored protein
VVDVVAVVGGFSSTGGDSTPWAGLGFAVTVLLSLAGGVISVRRQRKTRPRRRESAPSGRRPGKDAR